MAHLRASAWSVAIAAGLAFLLTACGGESASEQPTETTTAAEPGAPTDATAAPTAPDVELEDTVVVAGSGGDLGAAYQAAFEAFTEETGVTIQWVEGLASDHIGRLVAQSNSPEIDLFQGELVSHFAAAQQGVWASMDPALVPNLANLPDELKLPDGTAVMPVIDTVGLWWNADKFEENGLTPPESWDDFWALLDEPALEGHVVLPAIDNGYMRSFVAYQLDDASDPTPVYERLAEYDSVIYEYPRAPAAMFDLAVSEQAWLGVNGLSRMLDMVDANIGVEYYLPDPSPVTPLSWSFVKNAPHPNAAQALVNWILSEEGLATVAENTGYAPALPVEVPGGSSMTEEELGRLTGWDYEGVQQNLEKWRTLFAEIVREIPAS